MAVPKITLGQVEQLVEVGSMQVGPEYMPTDFGLLLQSAANTDGNHGIAYIQRIETALPRFRELSDAILTLAGYVPMGVSPQMSSTVYFDALDGTGWHSDFGGALTGFSVLFSAFRNGSTGQNQLSTAGRGPVTKGNQQRAYNYANGPVIIAQTGFCMQHTPANQETGATWHLGKRTMPASFVGLDVLSPYRISKY